MRSIRKSLVLSIAACALFANCLLAVEVKLTVAEAAGVARKGATVTSGVPFAKGAVTDLAKLSASLDGKPIAAQFVKLAQWDDGSIRWALLDTQVDVAAKGKVELVVRDDGKNVAPATPVKVIDTPDAVSVSTGPLELVVDRKDFNLFKSIKLDGKEQLTSAGRGLVLVTADGKQVAAGPPEEVKLEQAGPMRTTVVLRGKYPGLHNGLLGYTVRITAFAGSKTLKVRVWLENLGAHGYGLSGETSPYNPEWFAFDGMAVELGLADKATAVCEGVEAVGKFKVLQACRGGSAKGGPASPDDYHQMQFTITGPAGELKKGDRTDGVVALKSPAGSVTVAIRHFWQNYEKAIGLDGQSLKLWLWPTEGQWPRAAIAGPYADKMLAPLARPCIYDLPGSVHKGYEMILDFAGRDAKESSAELSAPLFAMAAADYYATTEAAPGVFAAPDARTGDAECDQRLAAWTRMAASVADPANESGLWLARQTTDPADRGFAFGWMDFGDIPSISHGTCSLNYDWPWIVLLNVMRTGDANSLRLGDEMIRHRVDVDQEWSDRTIVQYRGLQRAGNTLAQFHCERFTNSQPNVGTTWLAGVVLYYMLTGDGKSLECIERTAKYLPNGWDWASRPKEHKDYTMRSMPGDMRAVSESMLSYCAMFDLTGDRKWLDAAVALFDRYVVPKWTALGPHLHDRNQIQQQDYLQEDAKYCYALSAFCELHRRTSHAKLFELLKAGCDKEFPDNYFEAPLYLANLNAYVALVTGKPDYAKRATEMWASAFPQSKTPPVYLPGNSTWTRSAAMTLRTGHLLQYCFWKKKDLAGQR